jgi:hypothetical protein
MINILVSNPEKIRKTVTDFVNHSGSITVGEWHYFGVGQYFSNSDAHHVVENTFGIARFYIVASSNQVIEANLENAVQIIKEKLEHGDLILSNFTFNKAIQFLSSGNYQIHPIMSIDGFLK